MDLTPPAEVAAVAAKALEMRAEQPPSNRGGTPVGVKRANQLANRENLSPRTIRRMVSFFARHEVDKQATGFRKGEDGFPSKGRQAWDLWGGDPGKSWAEKMQRKLDAEASPKQENKMIDVNVLTGADVRRIDGKYGKVSKVSMPWVTVKWDNGMEESYLRSDEALAEDIELKTLDKGWLSLGSVVGTAEVAEQAAQAEQKPAEEAATKSTKDLIAEARRLAFCLSSAYRRIEEARQSTKEKAKALKAKKKAKKEKAPPKAKTGGANNPNPTNPFHNYKTIGKYSPKKKKRTEKKIWKCKKSGDGQMCVAQKDVPSQGIKKGQEKFITRWAGKEAYDTDYDMGRAAGDYKLPNKAVAAVAHKYY